MNASHSALTAIAAAGKVEEILDTDTSRPYEPSLPEDPKHFEGIRMDHVSYGYEGRSRALQDISLTVPKERWLRWWAYPAAENPQRHLF